ncbi:MAG: hypothetical protein QOF41_2060 [Methylobacteriaceae bacterium]|nr:hypothetical protein [Methylobacteriaceae bacterium]
MDHADSAAAGSRLEVSSSYETLAALRQAHTALRHSISAGSQATSATEQVRAFVKDVAKAGARLADVKERRAAQIILDYWSAELAATPGAQGSGFSALKLEEFEGKTRDVTSSPAETDKSDQRALIRFSAFAREWEASDRQSGYLLTGDAIKQAARFREADFGLDKFVSASEAAERRSRRRWRSVLIGGTSIAVLLLCFSAALFWQFWYLTSKRDFYIANLKLGIRQLEALSWLSFYQPWMPPYDLSSTAAELEGVKSPGLRLYAPNFAELSFDGIIWPDAQLEGASFAQSQFSFDGEATPNNLEGANLRWAQFRGAQINSTSFFGADLFRAVFDRAKLCHVDFSNANLRSASFWSVTLDDFTKERLKNTAWWQAIGWPWSIIEQIANETERQREAHLIHLKATKGYNQDIQRGLNAFRNTSSGTLQRALALNDIAWTRAVWGIDVSEGQPSGGNASPESPSYPCADRDVPSNARQAAERAVCILTKLPVPREKGDAQAALLAGVQDTLAYVLMQNGRIAEALKLFEEIRTRDREFAETGETLFRYAVAEYTDAVRQSDDARQQAAVKAFQKAIGEQRYQPTHELATLRGPIFHVSVFVELLKEATDKRWPSVSNNTACPKPAPAQ